ncbi:MAG: ABC transporter substrate-binding protein [Methanosarcina sp.]|jgi:iron complex transport system substrate-binding protein|nr:ABC transporter substrate-binding protein [Methanosarcina sp.]MDD3872855.1 ABC transporter substrate-binding protein [Methanosarcina sp.]MDD4522526.1 ABC transporter substrate-binding protein [Methanosarcina sp.]HHV24981.1 ABC transporter substrate-binding protein [Methanosarcina sp.]
MSRSLVTVTLLLTALLLSSGCMSAPSTGDEQQETVSIVDAVGREVQVPTTIDKVVSLGPDSTRILVALGDKEKIVGVDGYSKLCPIIKKIYPEVTSVSDLGNPFQGTLSIEKIAEADPDVVFIRGNNIDIADKIQNEMGIPTVCIYATVHDYDDFLLTIDVIGKTMGKEQQAKDIEHYVDSKFKQIIAVSSEIPDAEKPVVLIVNQPHTKDPLTVMPSIHPSTLQYAGGKNAAAGVGASPGGSPWRTVSLEQLAQWSPDYILIHGMGQLSPEELMANTDWQELKAIKEKKVGKVFIGYVGYDPALLVVQTLHMAKILHPDKFDFDFEQDANDVFEVIYGVDGVYSALEDELGLSKV